jgi:hypothetical protein
MLIGLPYHLTAVFVTKQEMGICCVVMMMVVIVEAVVVVIVAVVLGMVVFWRRGLL